MFFKKLVEVLLNRPYLQNRTTLLEVRTEMFDRKNLKPLPEYQDSNRHYKSW